MTSWIMIRHIYIAHIDIRETRDIYNTMEPQVNFAMLT